MRYRLYKVDCRSSSLPFVAIPSLLYDFKELFIYAMLSVLKQEVMELCEGANRNVLLQKIHLPHFSLFMLVLKTGYFQCYQWSRLCSVMETFNDRKNEASKNVRCTATLKCTPPFIFIFRNGEGASLVRQLVRNYATPARAHVFVYSRRLLQTSASFHCPITRSFPSHFSLFILLSFFE